MHDPTAKKPVPAATASRGALALAVSLGLCALAAPALGSQDDARAADAQHRAAVEQARSGRAAESLPVLEQLVARHPDRSDYLHDYVAVAHWAGEHRRALDAGARVDAARAPVWVLQALGGAARELGLSAEALRWYDLAAARAPDDLSLQLSRVYLLSDARRHAEAGELSERLAARHGSDPRVWLARGYALRQQDELGLALLAYAKAQQLAPGDPDAIKAQVILLRRLGAPHEASALLASRSELLDADEKAALLQDRAAKTMRWGALDPAGLPQTAAALDRSIAEMQSNLASDARGPAATRGQRIDLLAALSERRRYAEAAALYEELAAEGDLPPYGQAAAATAYAALRKPERALPLYEAAVKADPTQFPWRIGHFYALVDLGRMRDAQAAIDRLAAETPPTINAWSPRTERENPDYLGTLTAQAQARAYAEQYREAHRLLDELVRRHPFDSGVQTAAAHLSEWRGHPRAARQRFEEVIAVDPANVDARIGLSNARAALYEHAAARKALDDAAAYDPGSLQLARARREQYLREAAWVGLDVVHTEDSRARTTIGGLRAATPLIRDTWRPFAGIDRVDGKLTDGVPFTEWRPIAGVEYVRRAFAGSLSVQNFPYANRAGVAARGEWIATDQWRVRGVAESVARDVPLPALIDGIRASSVGAGATWRRDESRAFSFDARRASFSDDNLRVELAAAWSERWREWPSSRLKTTVYAHTMSNTIDNASYFNPSRATTLTGEVAWEWAEWRYLDRYRWHEFAVAAGGFAQQDYRNTSLVSLRYGLRWKIDDATDLGFGIGVTHRAYDGEYGYYRFLNLSLLRRL